MRNVRVRFSDRVLSIVLAVIMILSVFPVTALAGTASELTTNIGDQIFKVGIPTEFTFSTVANDDAGVMVFGRSDFSDTDAIDKLEYKESKDGKWYEFSGDFGPSTGFPMSDTTSEFRVTFNKAGTYTFTASMISVEDNAALCSVEVTFDVEEREISELITDIGSKEFVVGKETIFSFETKAHDYEGTMVIGSSNFSDTKAIDLLQYLEPRDEQWYDFSGNFGPSTGFPMSDTSSQFKVVFNKAGDYSFEAFMEFADGDNKGQILCSSGEIGFHVKDIFQVSAEKTGNGQVFVNEDELTEDNFAEVVEGSEVEIRVIPAENYLIESVVIGDEIQKIEDRHSFSANAKILSDTEIKATFIRTYQVEVDYNGELGEAVVKVGEQANAGGSVTVISGDTFTIEATPYETYRVSNVVITGDENEEIVNEDFSGNEYDSSNPYVKELTANQDYHAVITFELTVWDVILNVPQNGKISVDNSQVLYGGSAEITIEPNPGYTIKTVTVNGKNVYDNIQDTEDDAVFTLALTDITENQTVNVEFEKSVAVSMSALEASEDLLWNGADALRKEKPLYVFKSDKTVTFQTKKPGMRITYNDAKTPVGGRTTQKIEINKEDKQIEKIELWYDHGWHEVWDGGSPVNFHIVFDERKPTVQAELKEEANNGYFNSDVPFTLKAEDAGYYSGLEKITYWIEYWADNAQAALSSEHEDILLYSDEDGIILDSYMTETPLLIDAKLYDYQNVELHAIAYDRAGNPSEEQSVLLHISSTPPAVRISSEDEQSAEATGKWYNAERTMTIFIKDRNDVFDETAANAGIAFANGSANDYAIDKWFYDSETKEHFAKVTFSGEGYYTWSYSYTNLSSLEAAVQAEGENIFAFDIDKNAPQGTIAAHSGAWDKDGFTWDLLLEKITFGLYTNKNATAEVVADTQSDALSGVQKVSYYVTDGSSVLSERELEALYQAGKFVDNSYETGETDAQVVVYARILDNAGNFTYIGTDGVIYDLHSSEIGKLAPVEQAANSIYGVGNVGKYQVGDKEIRGIRVNVDVTDKNSSAGDVYSGIRQITYTVKMGDEETQSGVLYDFRYERSDDKNSNGGSLEIDDVNAEGTVKLEGNIPQKTDLRDTWSGYVIIDADKNNGKAVTLTIFVTDNSGNTSTDSMMIREINMDDITASVSVDGKAVTLENGYGWYDDERTVNITIIDRNSCFNASAATDAIHFFATDKDDKDIPLSEADVIVSEWKAGNAEDEHVATVTFKKSGNYTWSITGYKNDAGNELIEEHISYGNSESPTAFAVDTTLPFGSVTVSGYTWMDKVLEVLTFGLYSRDSFEISTNAGDDQNISDVIVEYYVHNEDKAIELESTLDALYAAGEFSADVPKLTGDQQFTVYIRITDKAGKRRYVSSDGHVIDNTPTKLEVVALDEPNDNGIYGPTQVRPLGDIAQGIQIAIRAQEAESDESSYSGIKEIRYEVNSVLNGKTVLTQEETLYSFDYTRASGLGSNGGRLVIKDVNEPEDYDSGENATVPVKDMLRREWSGVIVVNAQDNNSCDVKVTVYVTDNAGTTESKTIDLDVDLTAPEISVSYDNNTELNSMFFDAPRKATVIFKEREHHFDQDAAESIIKENITAKNSAGEDVKNAYSITWLTPKTNTSNPDDNTFTAVIAYNLDAHFTFDVNYTDKAGNTNSGVTYAQGTKAPKDFYVDCTPPTGSVTVNGNVWDEIISFLTFGLYNQNGAKVTFDAFDATSPVTVKYYKDNGDFYLTAAQLADKPFAEVDIKKDSLRVNPDEQFVIYVLIEDYAGHQVYINSDGYIIDSHAGALSVTAVDRPNSANIYGISDVNPYGDVRGVKVRIDVNETDENSENETVFSGIQKIEYEVKAVFNGKSKITQKGVLYNFDYVRKTGRNSNGGKLTVTDVNVNNGEPVVYDTDKAPVKADLLKEWHGAIIVDADLNNSNDVTVVVKAIDNAGNTVSNAEYPVRLDIDMDVPVIELSYDNNKNNTRAGGSEYFDNVRVATVKITERTGHFNSLGATSGIVITSDKVNPEDTKTTYVLSSWSNTVSDENSDKTVYTAQISFNVDAHFGLDISYASLSGNSVVRSDVETGDSVAPYDFYVDRVAPSGTVSINDNAWEAFLRIITFGLYSNSGARVSASVTDKTSDVLKTEYYKTNEPVLIRTEELETKEFVKADKADAFSFSINKNDQLVVYVRMTDYAGNVSYIMTDGYIVDTLEATISLTEVQTDENFYESYYRDDVDVEISVTDKHEGVDSYSGIAKIEYTVSAEKNGVMTQTQSDVLYHFDYERNARMDGDRNVNSNGGKLVITDASSGEKLVEELDGIVPVRSMLKEEWRGKITVDAVANNSSNVIVEVKVTDNAGNEKSEFVYLDIDVIKPTVKITFDNNKDNNGNGFYDADRTATIVITERSKHFDAKTATEGVQITAKNAKGEDIENAYTISSWTTVDDWKTVEGKTPDDATHTATVHFAKDANYTFDYSYTDKAQNTNTPKIKTYQFTVDTTVPTGTVKAVSAEGRETVWNELRNALTFGFWSNKSITVSGEFDDETSPIADVSYYKAVSENATDATAILTAKELDEITEWAPFKGFSVKANEQFTVYLKVTDKAGNYRYLSTNGLIVDDQKPLEEAIAPEITVTPEQPVNGIYNRDVKVSITVDDPLISGTYSGLKQVSYKVFDRAASETKPTQEGVLFNFTNSNPKQADLVKTWEGSITVDSKKNNSNDVRIVIYAVDNSLNDSDDFTTIKLDTTAPVINVSYNNNNADNGTYFNADRTATIAVTERNFKADDVKVTITNTDGTIPVLSSWRTQKGSGNQDDTVHLATITYSADGDYDFDVTYADLAGNKAAEANFAAGTVAPKAFTLDKTLPVVNVSFDNNSAANGKYFKANRTATVVVNEHNFDVNRVTFTQTAALDGSVISNPSASWANNGDVHTATIAYTTDGDYTFNVAVRDMAGNDSAAANYGSSVAGTDFTIDTKIEKPVIGGVENEKAYAYDEDVIPTVAFEDINYDSYEIIVQRTSFDQKNENVTSQFIKGLSTNARGLSGVFDTFERIEKNDGIYTLTLRVTDKAGNEESDSVIFSVNRFGSTYEVSDDTVKLNGTFVQEARDVVITEINPTELEQIVITVFKNNETIILSESDYTVRMTGGNGQWYQYVYTIKASNFEDDGVYRITIHSEDKAKNVAENTLDTKASEISFGIDKTAPTINVKNLESKTTYALDNLQVFLSSNDNLRLASLVVYHKTGSNSDSAWTEYSSWTGEELEEILKNGDFEFGIPGDSTDAHSIRIVATDAAGNETVEEISDFYVTTNLWVRYYTSKPLFYGSIGGVVALTAAIIFLVVLKRRKEEEK